MIIFDYLDYRVIGNDFRFITKCVIRKFKFYYYIINNNYLHRSYLLYIISHSFKVIRKTIIDHYIIMYFIVNINALNSLHS